MEQVTLGQLITKHAFFVIALDTRMIAIPRQDNASFANITQQVRVADRYYGSIGRRSGRVTAWPSG